jgi:hypothetical protein
VKRFTRLTHAFSKKLDNLAGATAIHIAVYNFVRIHGSLRCTPAMAAGVVDKLLDLRDLFDVATRARATEGARCATGKAARTTGTQRLNRYRRLNLSSGKMKRPAVRAAGLF